MDKHELHRRAVEDAGGSQNDVARALDVNRSSVSRASHSTGLKSTGLKHAAMQARILSLLEGAAVQRRSTYEGADAA